VHRTSAPSPAPPPGRGAPAPHAPRASQTGPRRARGYLRRRAWTRVAEQHQEKGAAPPEEQGLRHPGGLAGAPGPGPAERTQSEGQLHPPPSALSAPGSSLLMEAEAHRGLRI